MHRVIFTRRAQKALRKTPKHVSLRIRERLERIQDIRAYDEAKHAIEAGEELVPSEIAYALLDGENPIRVWREHRGLTQRQLAHVAEISVPYLSQLETGVRNGTTEVLSAIAKALDLDLDDILSV
jgi:DNA-binding XRE family transcriptional regulator